MNNVRIAVLGAEDNVCAYLDNSVPDAMHYFEDIFHTYLQGSGYTLEFRTFACHEDTQYLVEGGHVSFNYSGKGYYCTIVRVEKDEEEIYVLAYGLALELTHETIPPYSAPSAMSFAEYRNAWGFEQVLVIGINEISDKRIKNEWTGTETILARLFSLANVFEAELEFVTELNGDYSLKQIIMNIYKKHSENYQGIGKDQSGIVLRYGTDIKGITKISDITELYTAIRPTGKDGLSLASLGLKQEFDADGNLEYEKPAGSTDIRAVQAREKFPSFAAGAKNDRWIVNHWEYDTDNINVLYGQSLSQLKKNCVPNVSYDVDAFVEADIGDTFTVADEEFHPALYLKVRVVEQEICFTDEERSKSKFDNFTELSSQLDETITDLMNELIEKNKVYSCTILSDNGIVFRNKDETTILTAYVSNGENEITDDLKICWTKDGEALKEGKSVLVSEKDIIEKSIYRYVVFDAKGKERGNCEVTVSSVFDGKDGEDAILLKIDSSNGDMFKNNAISTTLTVTVIVGDAWLDTSVKLKEYFGENAILIWEKKGLGETEFTEIPGTDPRLSDDGFIFTISTADVETKAVFNCKLDC